MADPFQIQLGPFQKHDQFLRAYSSSQCPSIGSTQLDELFRYDGHQISIRRFAGDTIWLQIIAENSDKESNKTGYVTHYLRFANEEALRATLHSDLPTIGSYQAAQTIARSVLTYHLENRQSSDFRYLSTTVSLQDIPADELPYAALQPGSQLKFTGITDPDQRLEGDNGNLYHYPVPQDDILVDFDGPRNWVGRFQDKQDAPWYLIVCIRDDAGIYIQHRLSFEPDINFRSTLAAGYAPTLETYQLANKIKRETIATQPDDTFDLIIDDLTIATLGDEAPTYANTAAHDAEWPQYAHKR